jgi:hypothetical protein
MADISKFSIVTYERKPGCWRAAITPKVSSGGVGGEKVRSVVTPDDYPSEANALLAAQKAYQKTITEVRHKLAPHSTFK